MRLIRAAEHRVMPWKNGLGSTTEVAVHPPGAGLEDFDWRISMASVTADGPFSAFTNIDRTLCVLDGAGILLDVAGRKPEVLTPTSAPCAFPGDAATSASLIDGAITDLNIMSSRARVMHSVERMVLAGPLERRPKADTTVILCRRGATLVHCGEEATRLAPFDSALFEAAASISLAPEAASEIFWIEFRRS
jgi:environmental stress-induced protein Ves